MLLPVGEIGSAYAALLLTESMISFEPDGRIDAMDYPKAIRWAEAAADGNLPQAYYYAGRLYGKMGNDAPADQRAAYARKSVEFLKRGSRAGHAEATALLALRFYDYQYDRATHPFNPDPQLSDERQKLHGYELVSAVRDRCPSCMWVYAMYCYKRKDFETGNKYIIRAARAGDRAAQVFCRENNVEY